jgi:hypothetical protein
MIGIPVPSKVSVNWHLAFWVTSIKSMKTYLCVLKMIDAKIYLWHLQAFLISGAKIIKMNYILIEV